MDYETTVKEYVGQLKIGEEFTYKTEGKFYRKGIKVGEGYMVPVGLYCETRESAQKQN